MGKSEFCTLCPIPTSTDCQLGSHCPQSNQPITFAVGVVPLAIAIGNSSDPPSSIEAAVTIVCSSQHYFVDIRRDDSYCTPSPPLTTTSSIEVYQNFANSLLRLVCHPCARLPQIINRSNLLRLHCLDTGPAVNNNHFNLLASHDDINPIGNSRRRQLVLLCLNMEALFKDSFRNTYLSGTASNVNGLIVLGEGLLAGPSSLVANFDKSYFCLVW